ncbi:MAG: ASKHA domain-containing protein [Verrucomicrobiota bacterium]
MSATLHLTTLHGAQTLHASVPSSPPGLADLLAQNGLALNTRCCKRGLCKGCAVRLEEGELREAGTGKKIATPGEVLSCLVEWMPGANASITIPSRSLLAHRPSVADDFKIEVPVGNEPLFAGDYGLAVDIGTTTVAVILVELASGRILARASDFNQQIRMGDDVLSRIELCALRPEMVARLQEAICRDTILPLAREACTKAGIGMERVGGMSVAGNSTMLHLLFGIDPSPMGVAPFTPRFLGRKTVDASAVGLCEISDLRVHSLPGLAAYVGADIAAGIFATGLHYESEPVLLVDVGTNGEIVLVKGDRLYACATAAGPAFEGSGLSCGMRATEGAIEGISMICTATGQISTTLKTIGDSAPDQAPGICGSAYIDFLSQARSAGILMESGRFNRDAVAANPALFRNAEHGRSMLLCDGENPPRISEHDVALLLQAKAAIAAGIQTLLDLEGVSPADVRKVYLAGGFGLHLDITHTIACGLLPGFSPDQVEAVGNTSLGGAYLAMLDRTVIDELDRIRARAEIVELNLDPGFEDRYIDNLNLPLPAM